MNLPHVCMKGSSTSPTDTGRKGRNEAYWGEWKHKARIRTGNNPKAVKIKSAEKESQTCASTQAYTQRLQMNHNHRSILWCKCKQKPVRNCAQSIMLLTAAERLMSGGVRRRLRPPALKDRSHHSTSGQQRGGNFCPGCVCVWEAGRFTAAHRQVVCGLVHGQWSQHESHSCTGVTEVTFRWPGKTPRRKQHLNRQHRELASSHHIFLKDSSGRCDLAQRLCLARPSEEPLHVLWVWMRWCRSCRGGLLDLGSQGMCSFERTFLGKGLAEHLCVLPTQPSGLCRCGSWLEHRSERLSQRAARPLTGLRLLVSSLVSLSLVSFSLLLCLVECVTGLCNLLLTGSTQPGSVFVSSSTQWWT